MNMWTEDLVLPEELRKERLQKEPASYTAWILGKSGKTQEKKRKAVIICPGGGYEHLSPREGEPIAMKYLAMGRWWLALFPGLFLVFVVVLFHYTGDTLGRLLDPGHAHQ